ncbi:hypothetical protein, partial [Nocardia sp. NPDC058497]|uniref:hypothetical protein n=1 Tax=Nocardia sp. NPDC058497 TaxID=3346529 RepID=UPI003652170C
MIDLPARTWHRRHYPDTTGPTTSAAVPTAARHTLLGPRNTLLVGTDEVRFWRSLVSYDTRPYQGVHAVDGVEVVPASIIVNTFATALTEDAADGPISLRSVEFSAPLVLESFKTIDVVANAHTYS